jgi:hypothetical protein
VRVVTDGKLICYEFLIKKYTFRIAFISPWWIQLPWYDKEKWVYYKKFYWFPEVIFESRTFCFGFAFKRRKS